MQQYLRNQPIIFIQLYDYRQALACAIMKELCMEPNND